MSFNRTVGIMVMILVAAVSGSFSGSGQSLTEQLDQVVQAWQPGWRPDPPVTGGVPARQGFRWRRKDDKVLLTVQAFSDEATARTELQKTTSQVSTGAVVVPGVGDRAYVAGGPGGFTTMYVAVGRKVFLLTLRLPPNLVKPLAERFAAVLRASDRE